MLKAVGDRAMTGTGIQAGRRRRGFRQAGGLIGGQVQAACKARGFALARLITRWEEIVGADLARAARPVSVSHARKGFGATLTLAAPGATAPLVEMQGETIRARVNAVYGFNAIARVHIRQTGPAGMAEGQARFDAAPARHGPSGQARADAGAIARDVADPDLRAALESWGAAIISNSDRKGDGQ